MKDTEKAFAEIAGLGNGIAVYSRGADDLPETIGMLLTPYANTDVELVLCIDTTTSMEEELVSLKRSLVPMLRNYQGDFKSFRVELLLFKDYYEDYLTRIHPFTNDLNVLQRNLDGIKAKGGRDIPEAVYEAIYDGVVKSKWTESNAANRVLVLIGDAPPHLRPRGKISKHDAMNAARKANVQVHTIILPQ
jgi:Mg-chelatase subunit ChlD